MTDHHPANDLRDLERGEHLVLFGFRSMALGHGDCPALRGAFCGLLGGDADDALCSLYAFVRVVGWRGVRRVRLHMPGCCALSPDEQALIGVVAAAQMSLFDGGEALLRERLRELLGTAADDEACLMAAQTIAAALACNGLTLPQRPSPPMQEAPIPTLHLSAARRRRS